MTDWQKIVRDQHFSETTCWVSANKLVELIFVRYTNGSYTRLPSLLAQDLAELKSIIREGKALATENQSILEDKKRRTAADIEEEVFGRRKQSE